MFSNVWIVGASSGIGLELVKLYLNNGIHVCASARQARQNEDLLELEKNFKDQLVLINVDTSSTESVVSAVADFKKFSNTLDLFIYNAAVYDSMKLAEWKVQAFENMININYLGAVRFMDALQKSDITQKRWVFNASLSAYFGLPYGGAYSASKSALYNLGQSLQPELFQKGIELQIINHGFVKSRLTAKNDFEMPQLLEANQAARKIYDGINKPYRFEIVFPKLFSLVIALLRILPSNLSLKITKKAL